MYSIYCSNIDLLLIATPFIKNVIFIKLINVTSNILNKGNNIQTGNSLVAIIWCSSSLNKMCFTNFSSAFVQLVDFSYNELETMETFCFSSKSNLKVMLLNHNRLRYLAPISLKKLIKLDLSHNRIWQMSYKPFKNLILIVLNISFNKITKIHIALNRYLIVDMLLTEDYRICCLMSSTNSICSTKPRWPQSCNVMFNTLILNVIIVFEFTSIILFNTFSFFSTFFQLKFTEQSKHISKSDFSSTKTKKWYSTFSVHIMLLNLNDILFGIYLASLFFANQYYGETYVINASNWLCGMYCRFLGFLSTFFLLNSLYFLDMLTISKMCAVHFPLKYHFKNIKTVFKYLIIGTGCNLVISIMVLCSYHSFEQKPEMPSSICLYFGENHSSHTLVITTISLVLVQLGSFILVAILYIIMQKKVMKSIEAISQNNLLNSKVISQSLLVTITNAICWLPSSAIFTTSLVMYTYPIELMLWNIILINPINSVIKPIIFCIAPTIRGLVKNKFA